MFIFNRKYKYVSKVEDDLEGVKVIHPLTGEVLYVTSAYDVRETWYMLNNEYVCVCGPETGYPFHGEPYTPPENTFFALSNTWLSDYLRDWSWAVNGRKRKQ